MSLLVIYNPACGDCTAEHFFNTHVIPRLCTAGRTPTEIVRTPPPGDAEALGNLFKKYNGDMTIVLGSGDGTLHDIVNCLALRGPPFISIRFVLVPCGTANALYATLFKPTSSQDTVAYKLRSLEAFLIESHRSLRQLTVSLTSLLGQGSPRLVASVVVTSTALHAAILRDSEKLRSEVCGIDRFKIAAQQNITTWYNSRVKLLPTPLSGVILIYDPKKGDFVPFIADHTRLDIQGPFAYFLSTVNVDRLEPEFRINPTVSKHPPLDTSMDIVVIRPQRDPTFTLDTLPARERFAGILGTVLTEAYRDGNHVNLRYSKNGDITEHGDGNTVVECFRCGGWEWIPDGNDKDAHFACVDGTIFEIEEGGQASCVASQTDTNLRNFQVYI